LPPGAVRRRSFQTGWMPARRADKAGRPSQPFQVVKTISIRQEPSLKFPKRLRVVNAGARTSHPLSLRPTPVKWIPLTGLRLDRRIGCCVDRLRACLRRFAGVTADFWWTHGQAAPDGNYHRRLCAGSDREAGQWNCVRAHRRCGSGRDWIGCDLCYTRKDYCPSIAGTLAHLVVPCFG